jgi:hypothetical protein
MGAGQPGTRRTFVVQIHADGTATVENLRTRERVPIAIPAVGARIEAWLAHPDAPRPAREAGSKEDQAREKR